MQLFDLHCDTLGVCLREQGHIRAQAGAVDLRRGRCFRPWIQAFAAFLPDGLSPQEAQMLCWRQLDLAHEWAAQEPDFRLWRSPADREGEPQPVCLGLLTVENGGVLGNDTSVLDILLSKHVKVIGFPLPATIFVKAFLVITLHPAFLSSLYINTWSPCYESV